MLFTVFMAGFFLSANYKSNLDYKNQELEKIKIKNKFSKLEIEAKSFSVFNLDKNEEIYSKNGDLILPLASLVKTMTALVALKEIPNEKEIMISLKAVRQEGDYGFLIGEKFNLIDLIKFTLIGSVNDSAYALSENIENYLEKMNLRAKHYGMLNSIFLNSTGLDINENEAGGYGTASDVNNLIFYGYLKYPEIFKETIYPEIKIISNLGKIYNIKNTNSVVEKIPNILFSKTGYTAKAGGNLSIIFLNKNNQKIAITLLGSTKEGRFSDMEKLINLAYDIDYGYHNK